MKLRKAIFIVTYKKEKDKILYLLLKRKLHWKGWEFPKGGIESNENLKKSVKREAFEESGLIAAKINQFNVSGKYKYDKIYTDRPGFSGQTYKLFSTQVKPGKTKFDKREHSGFKWLNFKDAIKSLSWPNQKKCLTIVNKFLTK